MKKFILIAQAIIYIFLFSSCMITDEDLDSYIRNRFEQDREEMEKENSWISLGKANFYDFVADMYFDMDMTEVELWQNDNDESQFRLENPYYALNKEKDSYFYFQLLKNGQKFTTSLDGYTYSTTVKGNNLVGFQSFYAFNDGGDNFYLAMPFIYDCPDTYNYVVDYQSNGLPAEIHLSPLYCSPANNIWTGDTSAEENITIWFPGVKTSDTSLVIWVEDFTEDNSGVILEVEKLGVDLTQVRVGIGSGTEESVAAAIQNDTLPYITISGTGEFILPYDFTESGEYTMVALGYEGNKVKRIVSQTFDYTAQNPSPEPNPDKDSDWKWLGYVEYTDGYMCANPIYFLSSNIDECILTYWVEIEEHRNQSGLFRLVNPYGAPYPYNEEGEYDPNVNCYLFIDATNPNKVTILESPQTLNWPNYSLEVCYSLADYYIKNDLFTDQEVSQLGLYGSYRNNKITFKARALAAKWSFTDYPEENDIYIANVVEDYNTYIATNGEASLLTNSDGSYYAPFCVDMSSLTTNKPSTYSTRSNLEFKYKKLKNNYFKTTSQKLSKKKKMTKGFNNRISKSPI